MTETRWHGCSVSVMCLAWLLVALLAGCTPTRTSQPGPSRPLPTTATAQARPTEPTPGPTVSAEPTLCPQATPEWLRVEPVTSPTDQPSQVVTVVMGNLEVVTITTESGVFTGTGAPAKVEVTLLPDTAHHLEVVAQVRELWQGGCRYGGYTLRTTRDRNGDPLIIEQGEPGPPRSPGAVIGPENVQQLAPLFHLAPDARLTADFCFRGDAELVSVGYADKISRWNLTTGEEAGRLGEGLAEAAALRVAASADGSLLATGGTADDPSVRLWDVETGEMELLGRHESLLSALAISSSGARLASGDRSNQVWVWDVARRQPVASFEGDVPRRAQAFSGFYWLDDETLIAGGSDAVYWWNVATRQLVERVARPDQAAFFVEVAFGPGGKRLAAVAQDENVYVWSRDAGWAAWPAEPGTQLSHVAFSPDGRLVAATSFAGKLMLWDAASGEWLASVPVSTGDIAAVRFSPDGRTVAVGGWDSPIGLWGVP